MAADPRGDHFIGAQLNVWEPAMSACPGQLGGAFSAVDDEEDRFLVTTLWRDETSHARCVADHLPALKSLAQQKIDLLEICGRGVLLERDWSV